MRSHHCRILSLFFFASMCSSQFPSTDIESLLEFKKRIQDPTGVLLSWSRPPADPAASAAAACPSFFHGVSCEPSSADNGGGGAVVSVDLVNLGLSGEVQLTNLAYLRSLRRLSLAGNFFSGRIPPVLGGLTPLSHLDLSNNRFYGPIPTKILDLPSLAHLNLSFNSLDGTFRFSDDENNVVSQLKVLDLQSNRLAGDAAAILAGLRNPDHVDLSGNAFYGALPTGSTTLSNLAPNLKYLNLSANFIGGAFFDGESVRMFRSLEMLDLGRNQINGELPSLRELSNLRVFRAADNQLFGSLPKELLISGMQLLELDLSKNGFSGEILDINSTTLKILNLSSNFLSGSLPSKLGSCETVDLSNNKLSGELSLINSWEDTLKDIDLSSNSLSGNLPNDVAKFRNLISLKIRNNSIAGPLPSVLGDSLTLTVLDLSLNKFSGSVSPRLFKSLTLRILNLSGNHFSGTLPLESPHLSETLVLASYNHLESLDLSDNSLSGSLPQEIANMQKLRYLNLGKNSFSGFLPREISKLNGLELLDLSNNHFEGEIPDLPQPNLKLLNLSYNNFSGPIPKSLSKFSKASFSPGNSLLIFSDAIPSGNANPQIANYSHHGSKGSTIAAIVGSIGAFMLVVFILVAFYAMKSQEFCGGGGNNFRRIYRRTVSKPPEASLPITTSFSNDHLLTAAARSVSGQKEFSTETVQYNYSDSTSQVTRNEVPAVGPTDESKSLSSFPLASSPRCPSSCPVDQPVILDVYSPDRLAGELCFLEGSLAFTAEELSRAPAEVLGRSSHGTTYKATLDGGLVLVVKWLRVGLIKHKKEFAKEARKVGRIIHPNIVPWRGYYWGPREQERLILSDYVNGDSLAIYLHESTPRRYSRLSVNQRLKIALDVTRGLCYLHDKGLAHGNLKPTNILLTTPDLTAKLADYVLHQFMTQNGTEEQILNLGALGYRAPELSEAKKPIPSLKGDVYAFGVILMELLTRRSAGDIISGHSGQVDLADWVRMCAREGRGADCFDRNITGLDEAPHVMDKLLEISLRCILPVSERPNIRTVFEDLYSVVM